MTVWVDTGVLLAMGVEDTLPGRFAGHFGGWARVCRAVTEELRAHSLARTTTPTEQDKARAATCTVRHLLVDNQPLQSVDRGAIDPKTRDDVRRKLRGLAPDSTACHGGETDLIALAATAQARTGHGQVLLANDAGASIVAHGYDIPTRHAGDVLAEFACADRSLDPQHLYDLFQRAVSFTGIAANARPRGRQAFDCAHDGHSCSDCQLDQTGADRPPVDPSA